jgi:aspartyl-tRNA(Asn)/glutamyl-tRNA(Gln) amidotransferase subunit A
MFDDIDVLVSPSTPLAAPTVGTADTIWSDGTTEDIGAALTRLTLPANVTGLPALSMTVGFNAAGLPLGMQIMGRPIEEATILRVGHAYESASDTVGRLAGQADAPSSGSGTTTTGFVGSGFDLRRS